MGYYMRFLQTDGLPVATAEIVAALRASREPYSLDDDGVLSYDGQPVAQIEVNVPGDGLFEEELEELRDEVSAARGRGKNRVAEALDRTLAIVAVQVLWGEGDAEATLTRIDLIWDWLWQTRTGLLQADGEGFYERDGMLLKTR